MLKDFLFYLLIVLALIVALFCLYALLLVVSGLFIDREKDYFRDSKYFRALLNSGGPLAIHGARIRLTVSGLDKLPADGRFLLVSNHRSKFDPIITWYILRDRNLAFISKKENFHVPFYGKIVRRCCSLPIDRENPREALKTIDKAAEILREGTVSMGVYPEGTRSQQCTLLPLHNGVFKIAQQAKVPIVVVAVAGTENIHVNFPRRATDVAFTVCETIPSEEVLAMRSKEIGERVMKDFVTGLEDINALQQPSCSSQAVR